MAKYEKIDGGDDSGWVRYFINLPRRVKRSIIMGADLVLLSVTLWSAMSLRLASVYVPETVEITLVLMSAPVIAVAVFFAAGLYKLVTRYISAQGTIRIFTAVAISVLIWALVILLSGVQGIPRSVILMYGLLAALLVSGIRQLAGWVLTGVYQISIAQFDENRTNVLIFGAGTTGIQLAKALKKKSGYRAVGFIDEQQTLWRQIVDGLKIYGPEKIHKLIPRLGVKEIFLAMPEASRQKRQEIIRSLDAFPVVVKTLPAIEDIASGRVEISDLRPVNVEDLLGRDPVPPDPKLLKQNILGKSVLVTGAGGSIGSELTRQVLKLAPRRVVLFDVSEVALYHIENELIDLKRKLSNVFEVGHLTADIEIIPILGSVLDERLVKHVLSQYDIDTIFHAAAYKHVPIVEMNAATGVSNNTLGTSMMAQAARDAEVSRFVLVSTDKAVRPTNIMGASKRMAELILQAHASDETCKTIFTMVRFGNVLDSSGSVVQRFRQQIIDGGPVTVTHRDVIRYFMSIPEAAELVIQAGAMGQGGDVFVLDMGEPVKIQDLAVLMIGLMGLEVQDSENPSGDILIEYTGLRPGEKLFEELLIGDDTIATSHPRIMRSNEPSLEQGELEGELSALKRAIAQNDVLGIVAVLRRCVEGYTPDTLLGEEPKKSENWTRPEHTIH